MATDLHQNSLLAQRLLLVGVASLLLTGCLPLPVTSGCGAPTPYLGGRPCGEPTPRGTGRISGYVYGAAGRAQPLPRAFITTGSVSTFAGDPVDAEIPKDELGQESPEVDDGRNVTVRHDFKDGKGPVLAERRLRRKAIKIAETEEPDATARAFKEKYVYLRAGEFFMEEVPEGISMIYASLYNVTSAQSPVTLFANTTVTDIDLQLDIPLPTSIGIDMPPHSAVVADAPPVVEVQLRSDGSLQVPLTVPIELAAPRGSTGVVITGVKLVYEWNDGTSHPSIEVNRIAVRPLVVPAAQPSVRGPAAQLALPLEAEPLKAVLKAAGRLPSPLTARVQFYDEAGFLVSSVNEEPLETSFVLRFLSAQ